MNTKSIAQLGVASVKRNMKRKNHQRKNLFNKLLLLNPLSMYQQKTTETKNGRSVPTVVNPKCSKRTKTRANSSLNTLASIYGINSNNRR